jgi:TonB family protein
MRRTAILFFVLLCLWTAAPAQERYCVERTYGAGIGSGGGGRRSEGLQAYRAKEVDRRAVITEKPQPVYTDEARENGTKGTVRLRAVLCPAGKVLDIRVRKGLPDRLTEQAIKAARGIRFRPAEKDGRAVAQLVTLDYNFRPE